MRILVADRNEEHLRMVAGLVARYSAGATLVVAGSPSDAFAAAGLEVPDLLIVGARMRDAVRLIECVREQSQGRAHVVALLSSRDRRSLCGPVLERAGTTVMMERLELELPPLLERANAGAGLTVGDR